MLGDKENVILSRELLRIDPSFKDFLYITNFVSVYHYDNALIRVSVLLLEMVCLINGYS